MLTVKHVEESGHETVCTAKVVAFTPNTNGENSDKGKPPTRGVIAYGVEMPVSDGCNRYGDGTIYVMNETGATVAKYDLSYSG